MIGCGCARLDTGTPDSLLEAPEFVRTLEKRQGFKITCLEEIAFSQDLIDKNQLERYAARRGKSEYATYLRNLLAA